MRLGDFEIHLLVASGWHPDAGTLFGVVPKAVWQRQRPADEDNLLRAACVGAVVRHRGRVIVCETGIGTKLDEKRARQFRVWEPGGLLASLHRLGVRPEEVDLVLTTHLHWDHAGGFTRRGPDGSVRLTFPRARHVVQRAEWDFALHPDPRSRAGYVDDDLLPVAEAGLLEVVDGEAEVVPGLVVRQTGGHTPGHQLVVFRASDDLAWPATCSGCGSTSASPGCRPRTSTSCARSRRRRGCSTRRPGIAGCCSWATRSTGRPGTSTPSGAGHRSRRSTTRSKASCGRRAGRSPRSGRSAAPRRRAS